MKGIISRHFHLIDNLLSRRYRALLFSIITMILAPSLITDSNIQGYLSFMLNTLTILLCIYAIHETKLQLGIGIAIAMIVMLINQIGFFSTSENYNYYFTFILYPVFYAFVVVQLMKMVIATKTVKVGVLFASINIYLLIGIIGGYLFMLIENYIPGSFHNLKLKTYSNPSEFIYFAFISLSTLGFGDIYPITPPARSVAMALGLIGPIYLTVLVALLVSRFDQT